MADKAPGGINKENSSKANNNSNSNEVETISPATRLLNKRRQMYENQEAYKLQTKDYQTKEIQFRVQEKELKDRDQEIQESLITFANYLDQNQIAMKKSDDNINRITEDNEKKDLEIARKEKQLTILRQKAMRIEKRKNAVEQYQLYLQKVQEKNPEEYPEIQDILTRYTVLTDNHQKLKNDLDVKEKALAKIKNDVVNYEKNMNTEIMKLNNDIAQLNTKFEQIDEYKQKIKTDEEETSSKQLHKITELSRILMAINNLEKFCQATRGKDNKSVLNYVTTQNYQEHKNVECVKKEHFNHYVDRKNYAMDQLKTIGQYVNDFKQIIQKLDLEQAKMMNSQPSKAEKAKEQNAQQLQKEKAKE